ncbi:MAG: cysteine synthase [Thermoprotei archaeon]|nr:MAG: cysteine synthase [Thermoprotei archaeon]
MTEALQEPLDKERKVYPGVISLLVEGWPTPLVRLKSECEDGLEVWAKLEYYNPFSRSVKDRPVWNMLRKAFEEGRVRRKVYEATSGNVGIALAALCNFYGLELTAFLPKKPPAITLKLLKILGARVVETEYETISREFWRWVASLAEEDGALNLNQFENDANPEVHYRTLAVELIEQLEAVGRKPDFAIAGIGTSGHIYAVSKRMRERYGGRVKIIGVQPAPGSRIPGIKRVETGPKWLEEARPDLIVDVSLEEAVEGVVKVARREGLLIGLSAGAVYHAYKKLAARGRRGVYVLIFPDDVFKYMDVLAERLAKSSWRA